MDRVTFKGKGPALVSVITEPAEGQIDWFPLRVTETFGCTTSDTVSGIPGHPDAVLETIKVTVCGEEVGLTGVPLMVPLLLVTRPVTPPGLVTANT